METSEQQSDYVFDVGRDDFDRRVVQESRRVPVLVDFWAAWCGPCRVLSPVLEQLAAAYAGKLLVAKVNSDEQQELAAEHGIRGLPTVQIYREGEVVEQFVGVQPEAVIRRAVDPYLARASDEFVGRALRAREAGDIPAAVALLREAVASDPENYRIHPQLVEALIDSGELADAEAILRDLPLNEREQEDARSLFAKLLFARAAAGAPLPDELERAVARDPSDLEARYRLSGIRALHGEYEAAMEQLLEIMRRNRGFRDDVGRRGLLALFQVLGGHGSLVNRYRARMSSALH